MNCVNINQSNFSISPLALALCLLVTFISFNAYPKADPILAMSPYEVNLQLKWKHQFQFAGYYAAQAKGYFQEKGLKVNIIESAKGNLASDIVSKGQAQFGVSDSELLLDYANGKPVVLLGSIFQHSPYILLSLDESKIYTPADLIGKRIMLANNQGATQFKAILLHEGIDLNKIKILPHSWNLQDLIDHKVDAMSAYITAEPNYLRAKGVKPAMLNSTNYGIDFYGDTLFTSIQEATSHPKQVEDFLIASQEGWIYALNHKEEIANLILKMDGVAARGITKEILLNEARDMDALILPNIIEIGHINKNRWQRISEEFTLLGILKKNIELKNFFFEPSKNSAWTQKKIITVATVALIFITLIAVWYFRLRHKILKNNEMLSTEVGRRKKVEMNLTEARAQINEIFNATSTGIAITDIAGIYMLVNPSYCKMMGFSQEELINSNQSRLIHEEDYHLNLDKTKQLFYGEINHFTIEQRYIRKDGTILWVRSRNSIMASPKTNVQSMITVAEDISEQILLSEKYSRNENLLKIASSIAMLGGWEIDLMTLQMSWSDEVSILHDMPGETPTLSQSDNMILPEFRALVKNSLNECINTGKPYDEVFQKITAKNRRIWVRSAGSAIRDQEGRIIKIAGAFQDITKYKLLELFNEKQTYILESIATDTPLKQILEQCIGLIENQYPNLVCAINLLDDNGEHLKTGASLSLPTDYLKALDSMLIDDQFGSFAKAAYLQKEVIVSDIATDQNWKNLKELALSNDLKACWSWPVFSSKHQVIGIFSAFCREIASPTKEETSLICSLVKTVGIAIEKSKLTSQLYLLESAISKINDVVLITQAAPIIKPGPTVVYVNNAFEKMTGYSKAEIIGKTPRLMQGPNTQPEELDRIRSALEKWQPIRSEVINYKKNGEEFWLEMEIVPIADSTGWYTHWVAVERDISTRKKDEIEMLRLNRALRMLSACNEVLPRATDEQSFINEICKITVEIGGYRMAWVGFAEDGATKSIAPVGTYGHQGNFLEKLNLSWSATNPRGKGPGGRTIRSKKTIIVDDIANNPFYPAKQLAKDHGFLSLISLPLIEGNRCFGLLAMYAAEVRKIGADEIKLLEEMAEDLSYGILNIRRKDEQDRFQWAVTKVASSGSMTVSNQFFEQLSENLATAVRADAAFIARFLPGEPLRARTLAAIADGHIIDNFEYDIDQSPCRKLLRTEHFVLSESLTDCFSPSANMVKLGMIDYIGHRLMSSKGKIFGMIFVMTRQKAKRTEFAISTLKIFATRAAAEIERQDYDRHIREQASLLNKAQDAIIVQNLDYLIQFWNKGAEKLYGWTESEALGKSIIDLIYPNSDEYMKGQKKLLEKGVWSQEISQIHKDGRGLYAEVHLTLVKDENGQPNSVMCINTDITERRAATDKVQYMAFYDVLTGLPNRQLIQDRMQHALAASARSNKYGALIFIDIDNFKTINDTQGHAIGDILLKNIAKRLLDNTRECDSVARLGGDEFIILLEELTHDSAEAAVQSKVFAEKLIHLFKESFEIDGKHYQSTPSIGISLFKGDKQKASDLLKQSDLAMYQAKAAGRNTFKFYDSEMQIAITKRVELEADLRLGLQKNEFVLHYQPQFDYNDCCIGAEVLLRWNHSTKGMIAPINFISLAEETLLILPIGEWIIKTACQTLYNWQSMPEMSEMSLAVNVSVNQFRQENFARLVTEIIIESGINPKKLKLELTESLLADNIQDIIIKMNELKAIGVEFSLDDFGTGYSSLNYLKRLPLNQLKIDQSFVREILSNDHDKTICRSIITLANSLGLEVIAEGVEELAQKTLLNKEGCHLFQGYYFSKPLPLQAFESFLKNKVKLTH